MVDALPHSQTAREWSGKVAAFILFCEDFDPAEDLGDVIVRLAGLLAIAPSPVAKLLGSQPRPGVVDRQLAAEAFESAALTLVGSEIGYLLSRSPNGTAVASTWIPGMGEEHTLKAADPVPALCGAIALTCLSIVSAHPSVSRSPAS